MYERLIFVGMSRIFYSTPYQGGRLIFIKVKKKSEKDHKKQRDQILDS